MNKVKIMKSYSHYPIPISSQITRVDCCPGFSLLHWGLNCVIMNCRWRTEQPLRGGVGRELGPYPSPSRFLFWGKLTIHMQAHHKSPKTLGLCEWFSCSKKAQGSVHGTEFLYFPTGMILWESFYHCTAAKGQPSPC